jgi:hypothetical protein
VFFVPEVELTGRELRQVMLKEEVRASLLKEMKTVLCISSFT